MLSKLSVGLILLLLLCGYFFIYTNNQQEIYQIKPGSNIAQIAKELKEKDIINSELFFIILANIMQVQPKTGYYQIGYNIYHLLQNFNKANIKTGVISLIPGKTVKQYYQLMKDNKYIKTNNSLDKIMRKLKIVKPYNGRFWADSYAFNYGDSAISIFARAYKLMNKKLSAIWKKRDKNEFIKNKYQLLILASLIEKESANNNEKSIIAGVFINRLRANMRLQTDPTVIYALGDKYTGKLKRKHLKIDSPYNTYRNHGLPIGAIANASQSSIIAASKPSKHNYLFFVAKDKNSHIFATSYKQHKMNIIKYLRNK